MSTFLRLSHVIVLPPGNFKVILFNDVIIDHDFNFRSLESKYSDKEWGQHKPKLDSTNLSAAAGPPIVPPQLTNFVLNQEPPEHRDPVLLPELKSHVMMNHMYAQSIRDQMLVMSTTARYKKKCVTILFYTPIE